jgi:hypothetical protein
MADFLFRSMAILENRRKSKWMAAIEGIRLQQQTRSQSVPCRLHPAN